MYLYLTKVLNQYLWLLFKDSSSVTIEAGDVEGHLFFIIKGKIIALFFLVLVVIFLCGIGGGERKNQQPQQQSLFLLTHP